MPLLQLTDVIGSLTKAVLRAVDRLDGNSDQAQKIPPLTHSCATCRAPPERDAAHGEADESDGCVYYSVRSSCRADGTD